MSKLAPTPDRLAEQESDPGLERVSSSPKPDQPSRSRRFTQAGGERLQRPVPGSGPRHGVPAAQLYEAGRVMAFRKISYLIPSCDGCGLAWSFYDPACAEGIPPHFASRAAALAQLEADYGWQIVRLCRVWPLMACRRCAAAGVIPAILGRRWLLA